MKAKGESTFEELLDALTGHLRKPRDWQALLQLASETLTIGTLASVVLGSTLESDLPPNVRPLLVDVLQRATARNERLLAQFCELLPQLNAAGVRPIVMRGLASLLASGTGTGRLMSDLDVLVPGQSRECATEVLTGMGYQIYQGFHGPPHAITMGRAWDVGMVDLHTNIQPYILEVHYERVAPLCAPLETPAGTVLLPNPTCALLLYVLHDQLHDGDYWRGLIDARHFVDIPRLVNEGVDWSALEAFFPKGSARNALHVQLNSARSLLGVDIPQRYCGGTLAQLQVSRRRLQLRFPSLMRLFTILSIAIDPPQGWRGRKQRKGSASRVLRTKSARALGPVNPGKVVLRSN